jgi:hypothetical protein
MKSLLPLSALSILLIALGIYWLRQAGSGIDPNSQEKFRQPHLALQNAIVPFIFPAMLLAMLAPSDSWRYAARVTLFLVFFAVCLSNAISRIRLVRQVRAARWWTTIRICRGDIPILIGVGVILLSIHFSL